MPEVITPQHRLSPQETYNTGRKHLLTQMKRSVGLLRGTVQCLYRSPQPDGTVLKCAAGPFIPDDRYRPGLEGYGIERLITTQPDVFGQHLPDPSIARELQIIHDNNDPALWEGLLNDLSRSASLSVVPL